MEIYQRVLSTMPQMFSTNEYLEKLKTVASNQKQVTSGKHIDFLKNQCHKVSNRTYIKRTKEVQLSIDPQVVSNDSNLLNEQNAVEYLKTLGYKVLKPNWVEL
jgi:hypothetical protein